MKNVSIIMINYNSSSDTFECIESIKKLNTSCIVNVIIVDNDSSIKEKEKIFNFCTSFFEKEKSNSDKYNSVFISKTDNFNIYFIMANKNYGFSGANNIGLEYSKSLNSEYFWILNNDTVIEEKSLDYLIEECDKHDTSIIGTTICEYYDKNMVQCLAGFNFNEMTCKIKKIKAGCSINDIENYKIKRLDCVSGCSMFYNKKTFEKIGFFDEDYFLYFEEVNLNKICIKNNIKKIWCRDAIIWHKEGQSIGSKNIKRKKSDTSEYYGNLSCLIYFYKYYKFKFIYIYVYRFLIRFAIHMLHFDFHKIKVLLKSYNHFFKVKKEIIK